MEQKLERRYPVVNGQKFCRSCQVIKPINEYYKQPNGLPKAFCIPCWRARNNAEYQKKTPTQFARIIYKTINTSCKKRNKVGITIPYEEFLSWYLTQEKKCEACGFVEPEIIKSRGDKLCVDHCYVTGKPRGILCWSCNQAEGLLRTPRRAEGLTRYMKKHDLRHLK